MPRKYGVLLRVFLRLTNTSLLKTTALVAMRTVSVNWRFIRN